MGSFITVSEALGMAAYLYPEKVGAKDLNRAMTYRELNERCCRLGNALLGLGLKKGDRFAAIAYNCVEWMEIYGAAAKAGLRLMTCGKSEPAPKSLISGVRRMPWSANGDAGKKVKNYLISRYPF